LSGGAGASSLQGMTTIPEGSRETLAALERNIGFIPNLAAAIAASPTAISGFVGLQSALRTSRLSGLEREVAGITVSRLNDCAYSLQGGSDALIAALRAGEPLDDERLEAIRAFAEALVNNHGKATTTLDDEEAMEVVAQVGYTTFANYAADVSGAAIDPAFTAQ
jgi:alkylhydroperoxidase family enzyme